MLNALLRMSKKLGCGSNFPVVVGYSGRPARFYKPRRSFLAANKTENQHSDFAGLRYSNAAYNLALTPPLMAAVAMLPS